MEDIPEETSQNQNSENQNDDQGGPSRAASVEEALRPQQRNRRLVSQSTFQENDLDNSILNSQQQFIDLSDTSSSDQDPDQAFEEYLNKRNAEAENIALATDFDAELPIKHSYLGENMDVVRGSTIYEPGKVYEIPVCGHHSMVFPGEVIPMIMISESIFARTPESNEGLTFGLIFADEIKNDKAYGVTCQVFEKGLDSHGHITVKSKAFQRFIVVRTEDGLTTQRNHNFYAKVKILPEYILPEPINLTISNNLMKFAHNQTHAHKLQKLLAGSSRWPQFVHDKYSIKFINDKVERYLAMLSISAPEDPSLKSFWLARNVPLNQADRLKIFTTNCINKRMMLIAESLNFMCYFNCKRCKTRIASYSDIFAMAKGNTNANYCNPAGYIHETLTVHKTLDNSVKIVDRPSTDFSWFPGYAWQIAVCDNCKAHVGWKFVAVNKYLRPKTFYGLSCKSLVVAPEGKESSKKDGPSDSSADSDEY